MTTDDNFELKPLSKEAIPAALRRAERYRFLNEPHIAASICRDILRVDERNQEAVEHLILAITEQFERSPRSQPAAARKLLPLLETDYNRLYYEGLILERDARACLHRANPNSGEIAYDRFRHAMELFEEAEAVRPKGNDDALLRWNTCVRAIRDIAHVVAPVHDDFHPLLE